MSVVDALVSTATLAGFGGAALLSACAEVGIRHGNARQEELASLRQQLADRERELRTHELTGIVNRRGFQELLHECMASGDPWSLVWIDLDGFKAINDTHGHLVGDLVLIEVAYRLVVGAGDQGIAAHISGDEFALLLPFDQLDAARLMARIGLLVAQQMRLPNGLRITVGMSAGVTAVEGEDPQALLNRADHEMYEYKRGRRAAQCAAPILSTTPPLGIERLRVRPGHALAVTR